MTKLFSAEVTEKMRTRIYLMGGESMFALRRKIHPNLRFTEYRPGVVLRGVILSIYGVAHQTA